MQNKNWVNGGLEGSRRKKCLHNECLILFSFQLLISQPTDLRVKCRSSHLELFGFGGIDIFCPVVHLKGDKES